jgi:hypothetical protein
MKIIKIIITRGVTPSAGPLPADVTLEGLPRGGPWAKRSAGTCGAGSIVRVCLFQFFVTFLDELSGDLKPEWPQMLEAKKHKNCFSLLEPFNFYISRMLIKNGLAWSFPCNWDKGLVAGGSCDGWCGYEHIPLDVALSMRGQRTHQTIDSRDRSIVNPMLHSSELWPHMPPIPWQVLSVPSPFRRNV